MVLVPVFAESLGASYFDLGLMGSAGSITYAVMTILSGYFVGRHNRAHLYTIGLLGIMVSIGLFSLTKDIPNLILLRTLLGVFSALFWVTVLSLVVEVSSPKRRVDALGRYNFSWVAGFIVGPILGGVIYDAIGFRNLSVVLGGVSGVCALVVLLSITPHYHPSNRQRSSKKILNANIFKGFGPAYLLILSYSVIIGVQMSLLPGYISGFGVSSSQIGLLMTASNGIRGFAFINTRRFISWGRRKSLNLAVIFISTALLSVAFSRNALMFLIPLLLFGLSGGIMIPIVQDAIAEATSEELGEAVGLYEAMFGIGSTIGPIFAGGLADLIKPETPYLVLSALALTMFLITSRMGDKADQTD